LIPSHTELEILYRKKLRIPTSSGKKRVIREEIRNQIKSKQKGSSFIVSFINLFQVYKSGTTEGIRNWKVVYNAEEERLYRV